MSRLAWRKPSIRFRQSGLQLSTSRSAPGLCVRDPPPQAPLHPPGPCLPQWWRGKQLLSSNSDLQISICDSQIADSLLVSGTGDLLPLIESALHVQSRLSLLKCGAGGCRLFSRYFLLLVTCTPQKPGPRLACAISFSYRSL